jgi:hypothetical protein
MDVNRWHVGVYTIHSKRSFGDLISRIESTFQQYDAKTLRDLTAEGDTVKQNAARRRSVMLGRGAFLRMVARPSVGFLSLIDTQSALRKALRTRML